MWLIFFFFKCLEILSILAVGIRVTKLYSLFCCEFDMCVWSKLFTFLFLFSQSSSCLVGGGSKQNKISVKAILIQNIQWVLYCHFVLEILLKIFNKTIKARTLPGISLSLHCNVYFPFNYSCVKQQKCLFRTLPFLLYLGLVFIAENFALLLLRVEL